MEGEGGGTFSNSLFFGGGKIIINRSVEKYFKSGHGEINIIMNPPHTHSSAIVLPFDFFPCIFAFQIQPWIYLSKLRYDRSTQEHMCQMCLTKIRASIIETNVSDLIHVLFFKMH